MRDRQMSLKEAKEHLKKFDSDQIAFVRKYFKEDINDPKHYDIMINTQHIGIESAAESVKKAFLAWKALRSQIPA
jgi:cytidylate kinase